ncbi:membrane hypothetical protein [Flavobacterium sp. 9AF]|uniref:DUF5687 family protein n=1 Tax=Flavobacterium sp. 9AF TaxID=2653142 RepID=UPI0012EF4397|nr:DUF5687 family protein [Flavobacterium sp. 9AF]VXB28276.1 membrane hypothetical protein [Flavobacterium sp. 9AF]
MIKQFLQLEWKAFTRSSSFSSNLVLKIFMIIGAIYFISLFTGLGIGCYFILKKTGLDPFLTVNKLIIYYLVLDLIIRFFFQKMPTLTIRPLLTQNIKKNNIVHFTLGKTSISFFNFIHWFFFIPFSITLYKNGFSAEIFFWCISSSFSLSASSCTHELKVIKPIRAKQKMIYFIFCLINVF